MILYSFEDLFLNTMLNYVVNISQLRIGSTKTCLQEQDHQLQAVSGLLSVSKGQLFVLILPHHQTPLRPQLYLPVPLR